MLAFADSTNGNGDYWLWLDARGKAFSMSNAVALFRAKKRWVGREPNAVKIHPTADNDKLRADATKLGLAVVDDPRIAPGTFHLGVKRG